VTLARALAALLALAAGAARAQPYDPAYRWRTLETPHFRVHFHQGEDRLAATVAQTAERAHEALVPILGWAPRDRTEVVLSDDSDDANGSATPVPYDTIRLFAAPPAELSELNAYRDWVSSLVFHEYVHILHLDNVGGIPHLANQIFGKLFTPNGLTPRWLIEGLAVLHEADGTPGAEAGRNRSTLHAMYVRSLAIEPPGFPTLDRASNPSLSFPLGVEPYLLGGRFLEFLQERSGPEAIAGYVADQGAWVWPYAPSIVGRPFFGATFPELWAEYAAREEGRAQEVLAQVRSRPVTRPARLTFDGGRAGWPRWTAGGTIVSIRRGLDETPAVVRTAPDGKPAGVPVPVLGLSGLAGGGGRIVVTKAQVFRERRVYDDLYELDLTAGTLRRLTEGARAGDPALSQDGAWLSYVRRIGPGELALVRRRTAGGPEETVFAERGTEVFAPAFSPDGSLLAFAVQREGRRDVAVARGGGAPLVAVTDDAALDASPAFTPDGRWLLFSSDRGGIHNLYAWPVEPCLAGEAGCAIRQVTNVETGAFQPAVSPDGKTIAFVSYSRDGYDIATMPFAPEEWLPPVPAPVPDRDVQDQTALPSDALAGMGTPAGETPPWADPAGAHPYSPWRTVGPTWWFPVVGADPDGTILGATTRGEDVLGKHSWALSGWWGLGSNEPGYTAAYLGTWSWPSVDLSSSRIIESAPVGRGLRAVWTPLDAGIDFTFTRLEWSALVRLGWNGTFRDVLGVTGTADTPEGLRVSDGFGSELTLRAAWSDARRYVRSISPEEGWTANVAAGLSAEALGSDYGLLQARGSLARYLRLPCTRHAVLAVRLAGGAADGSLGTSAPFTLGGPSHPDPLSLLLGSAAGTPDELRGYPVEWLAGTGFALANAELRFPIAAPEHGYSTWPVYLRRIHGAAFADLGDAFDLPGTLPFAGHEFRWDELRLGAGAELRLELSLGYVVLVDLRLGVAHAFGRALQGESQEPGVGAATAYAVLGGAF
jgi:hypothetical protein